MSIPQFVRVCEMGPRDGLQNEDEIVSTGDKVRYIDLLSETGLTLIEATSFVSPKAIPQLADAAEVFTRIKKRPGVRYPVLTPNLRGLERAKEAGASAIAVFTAASEEFTKRNINMTIDQALQFIISCGVVLPPHQLVVEGTSPVVASPAPPAPSEKKNYKK